MLLCFVRASKGPFGGVRGLGCIRVGCNMRMMSLESKKNLNEAKPIDLNQNTTSTSPAVTVTSTSNENSASSRVSSPLEEKINSLHKSKRIQKIATDLASVDPKSIKGYMLQDTKSLTISELTRKYGTLVVGVYLSLSFMVFCSCFAFITFMGITAEDIKGYFTAIQKFFGYNVIVEEGVDKNSGFLARMMEWMGVKDERIVNLATNFLLAIVMTKLFTPVKVLVCVMVVPRVARKMEKMGFDLAKKGIKNKIKSNKL